jgi:hypothetical protein
MPITDLALLLFLLISLVMLGSVVSIFISVSKYYYLCCLLLIIGTYFFLRYMNRQQHPAYILSSLSFYFKQPKKITQIQFTTRYGKNN